MDFTETAISQKTLYNGVIVNVRLDLVSLCDGRTAKREVVEHPGGVGIVALTDDMQVVVVRQYRYVMGKELVEIPAGKLEKGEDPLACALRELSEETGYIPGEVVSLGKIYSTPGFCSETLHLYLARKLVCGESHPDDGEFLQVETVPFQDMLGKISSGSICDAKTVCGILKAKIFLESEDR